MPHGEKQEIIKQIPEPILKPWSPYQKQLNNKKTYYQKDQEDIINRIKNYNKQIPKEEVIKRGPGRRKNKKQV